MLKPINDEQWSIFLVVVLTLFVFIFSTWIFTNIPGETKALWFTVCAGMVLTFAMFNNKIPYIRTGFFGNKSNAFVGAFAGLLMGLIVVGKSINIFGSAINLTIPTSIIPSDTLSLIYVVLLSPIIEELFFRGVLVFTTFYSVIFVLKQLRISAGENSIFAGIIAITLPNLVFALYHILAYSTRADINSVILQLFVIGVIWTIGYLATRSLAFPVAFHIVNNALVSGTQISVLLSTLTIALFVLIVFYFALLPILRRYGSVFI